MKMRLHQLLTGGGSTGSPDDDLDSKSVHHSVLLYLRKNVSKYDLSLNEQVFLTCFILHKRRRSYTCNIYKLCFIL